MLEPPKTCVAVDWSGSKDPAQARKKIWLARVEGGKLVELSAGRTRHDVTEYLIELTRKDERLVVGLDFCFSFPRWFLEEHELSSPPEAWKLARDRSPEWLRRPLDPAGFFYTRGSGPSQGRYRETERAMGDAGFPPESIFKCVGAKQVGPGSVRGMPHLLELQQAGFSIWPFDEPELPLVVEIYPACLYPKTVTKSRREARRSHLDASYPEVCPSCRSAMAGNDDAFDAGVSALVMWEQRPAFTRLEKARGTRALEGEIWRP